MSGLALGISATASATEPAWPTSANSCPSSLRTWMWPVPVVILGLLFVISATRRVMAQREVVPESADAEVEPPDEVGP
jgi:hypothetical protein